MAGEATVRLTRSIQFGAGTVGGTTEAVLADHIQFFSLSFGTVTNIEVDIPITLNAIKAIGIVADHDCTLITNSTSSPDDSFTLKANKPLLWSHDDANANFITTNVTKFYLSTTTTTVLKIGVAAEAVND